MTLQSCYWHRLECGRCGEYDLAQREEVRDFAPCLKCGAVARVLSVATGKTVRALPYASTTVPIGWNIQGTMEQVRRGRVKGVAAAARRAR